MFVIAVLESNTMVLISVIYRVMKGLKRKMVYIILNMHYRRSKQSLYPSLV